MTIVSDVAREFALGQKGGFPIFHPTCFGPWEMVDSISSGDDPAQSEQTIRQDWEAFNRNLEIAASRDRARRAVDEVYDSVPSLRASMLQGASDLAMARVYGLLGLAEDHQSSTSLEMEETLATQFARLGDPCSVRVCWQGVGSQRKSFRCLLTTHEQHQPFRGISSSRIQEMMHELKGYKLKSALESMALSPDLLWDMLLPKRMRMPMLELRNGTNTVCAVCSAHRSMDQFVMKLAWFQISQWKALQGRRTVDDLVLPSKEYSSENPFTSMPTELAKRSTINGRTRDAEGLGSFGRTQLVVPHSCFYTKCVDSGLRKRERRK